MDSRVRGHLHRAPLSASPSTDKGVRLASRTEGLESKATSRHWKSKS